MVAQATTPKVAIPKCKMELIGFDCHAIEPDLLHGDFESEVREITPRLINRIFDRDSLSLGEWLYGGDCGRAYFVEEVTIKRRNGTIVFNIQVSVEAEIRPPFKERVASLDLEFEGQETKGKDICAGS